MQLVAFSKCVQDRSVPELIALAHEADLDGYDLCVRPDHQVTPDNVGTALPEVTRLLRQEGVEVPMVTGNFDLLGPDHPTAEPILKAMEAANIRFLKLGYFVFDPEQQDYWAEVDRARRLLEAWEAPARRHGVCVCYHTHSHGCLGVNCAALMHLLQDRDPECLGAYLDTAQLLVEGEEWSMGLSMAREYLQLVALKDVLLVREPKNEYGSKVPHWVAAGEGMVDWEDIFAGLRRVSFAGPLSLHCEIPMQPEEINQRFVREVQFYRQQLEA